jgi:hypothetical protein
MLKTFALCTLAHRRIGRLHDQYAGRVRLTRPLARLWRVFGAFLARPLARTLARPFSVFFGAFLARLCLARIWRVFGASFGAFPGAYFISYLLFRTKFTCERGWYLFIIFHFALLYFARSSRANGVGTFSYFSLCVAFFRSKFTRERGCFCFSLVSGRYFCSRGGRVGIYTVSRSTPLPRQQRFLSCSCYVMFWIIILSLFIISYYNTLYRLHLI